MSGIEILAIEEIGVEFAFNWMAFFITFGAILVIFLLFGIYMSVHWDDWFQLSVGIILGIILGIVFGFSTGVGLHTPTTYENQYKITISDEVSMNEFTEKYEIIDQEGKIYTVREIE